MALQSEYVPDKYVGNGATTVFPYTFKAFSVASLKVEIVEIANETNVIPLTYNTDYTLTNVGEDGGGNLTLGDMSTYTGSAILPATYRLVIYSDIPYIQTDDLVNQQAYDAEKIEERYDYITRLAQQNKEALTRAVKVDIGSDETGDDVMAVIEQAVEDSSNSANDAANSAADAANSATDAANSAVDAANSAATAEAAVSSVVGTYYTSVYDSVDTYYLTIAGGTAPTSYVDGLQARFIVDLANTTSPIYIDIEGLGKKSIVNKYEHIMPGDFAVGDIVNLTYVSSSDAFFIVDKVSDIAKPVRGTFAIPIKTTPNPYIDFQISSGVAKFSDGNIYLCPAMTKSTNGGYWSAGDGNKIMCEYVVNNDSGYIFLHQFAIVNNVGDVDYLSDSDVTGANLYTDSSAISWGIVAHVRIGTIKCLKSASGVLGYVSQTLSGVIPINDYDAEVTFSDYTLWTASVTLSNQNISVDFSNNIGLSSLSSYKFMFTINQDNLNSDNIYRFGTFNINKFTDYGYTQTRFSYPISLHVSTYGKNDSQSSSVIADKYLSLPKVSFTVSSNQTYTSIKNITLVSFIDTRN